MGTTKTVRNDEDGVGTYTWKTLAELGLFNVLFLLCIYFLIVSKMLYKKNLII